MNNLTPEAAYIVAAASNLIFFILGWILRGRGKKKG